MKTKVAVWDPEPGSGGFTSLISLVSDPAPVSRSLHQPVDRRCTCGQRAFRAFVFAFSLNTSWSASYPSSTLTSHTRNAWERDVPCSIHGRGHVRLPPVLSVAWSLFASLEADTCVSEAAGSSLLAHVRSKRASGQNCSSWLIAARGSFTLSPTKLAIEFAKIR